MSSASIDGANKVAFSSKDFLSVQSRLQNYVQELTQQASVGHPEERIFVKNELDQWTSSLLLSLAENSSFTDSDGIGSRATLDLVDPTDEELKEAVKKEESNFSANLLKVVRYRAHVPPVLANLSQEICESESQAAEQLEIHLPELENKVEGLDLPIDAVKKEYKDAMHILSYLHKTVPEEINQIERLREITTLMMKQN